MSRVVGGRAEMSDGATGVTRRCVEPLRKFSGGARRGGARQPDFPASSSLPGAGEGRLGGGEVKKPKTSPFGVRGQQGEGPA